MARKLTARDVAMVLELRSEGVKWGYIAHYGFGITVCSLWHAMRTWGAV